MEKISVLLLCRHNSGRSQMAEAFFNEFAGHKIHAEKLVALREIRDQIAKKIKEWVAEL